jgi:phage gp36-like protein
VTNIPDTLKATVADMRIAYPECELVELTNLDDASATVVDDTKIQFALDQAFALACAYDTKSCPAGQLAIRLRLRRAMLTIARHEMDIFHRRDDVNREYERTLKFLEDCTDERFCNKSVDSDLAEQVGLTSRNGFGIATFGGLGYDLQEQRVLLETPYLDTTDLGDILPRQSV